MLIVPDSVVARCKASSCVTSCESAHSLLTVTKSFHPLDSAQVFEFCAADATVLDIVWATEVLIVVFTVTDFFCARPLTACTLHMGSETGTL